MPPYIHENPKFPAFVWDARVVADGLTAAATLQGQLLGKMQQFGFGEQQSAMLDALTNEIAKSGEIEGEILDSTQLRSSLARQLNQRGGAVTKSAVVATPHIDGVTAMMIDATQNYAEKLTLKRLFGWHAALFPTGFSGIRPILVGRFRREEMAVVGLRHGREVVYYEAPLPTRVPELMRNFLRYLNAPRNENPLLKAAIAHLWFVIIHPFDDGNGRLARAITDWLLARAENTPLRFYALSAQIQREKKAYYRVLQLTTGADQLDLTPWLKWFFACLCSALENSLSTMNQTLKKAVFWRNHHDKITDDRERRIVNLLFDGFKGNMTSSKIEKICKVSQDTATRLLQALVDKGVLNVVGAGRGTHYLLARRWS